MHRAVAENFVLPRFPRLGREEDRLPMLKWINHLLGGDPNAPGPHSVPGPRLPRQAADWDDIQFSGLAGEVSRTYFALGLHIDLTEDEIFAYYVASKWRDFEEVQELVHKGEASPAFLEEIQKLRRELSERRAGRPKRKTITHVMVATSDVERIEALWREHYPDECANTKHLRSLACEFAALRWGLPKSSVEYCISRARWRELP